MYKSHKKSGFAHLCIMVKDWIPKIELKLGKTFKEWKSFPEEGKIEALIKIQETVTLLDKLANQDFLTIVEPVNQYIKSNEKKLTNLQRKIVSYNLEPEKIVVSFKNQKISYPLKTLEELKLKLNLESEFINIQLAYLMSPEIYVTIQLLENIDETSGN